MKKRDWGVPLDWAVILLAVIGAIEIKDVPPGVGFVMIMLAVLHARVGEIARRG